MVDNDEDAHDENSFDELVLEYLHVLRENGRGRSVGTNTIYAIFTHFPELRGAMPRSLQGLKGWTKLTPSTSYPPITRPLAYVVAWQIARRGKAYWRHAAAVILAFDCLLRVGELVRLRRRDVSDARDTRTGGESKAMLVTIRYSKTGKDQSVEVHDPQVMALMRTLLRVTKPGQLLFPFSAGVFRRAFKGACAELHLSPRYVLHSLRHGGATYYFFNLGKSVEDVMRRGRWASAKSARGYIQTGPARLLAETALPVLTELGLALCDDLVHQLALTQKH
jgi:integrase